MKLYPCIKASTLLTAGLGIAACAPQKPYRRIFGGRETAHALKLEGKADISVNYTYHGRFDIGIGPVKDGVKSPQSFLPGELTGFFDAQRHKNLVVVIFEKSMRSDEEIAREVSFLNVYFKDRGYRRIVIQQHTSSLRPTYSDIRTGL